MSNDPWKTEFVEGTPRIAMNVMGEGPLLVLLHGIGGNRLNWQFQLPAFADDFTVVAWDARGYGLSDDYDSELHFNDFSHDLARLLDHFGAAKAHLCGLSMGGRVAQDFFALYPERVATLVLCDTFAGDDVSDTRSGRSQTIEEFVQSRIQPFLDGVDPAEVANQRGGRLMSPSASQETKQLAIDATAQLHVESYIKTVRASAAFSRVDNLVNIDVPTLLLFGDVDPLTPPSVGEYMQERIEGSQLVIIGNAGHMTNLEQPNAFNSAVLGFLQGHRDKAN